MAGKCSEQRLLAPALPLPAARLLPSQWGWGTAPGAMGASPCPSLLSRAVPDLSSQPISKNVIKFFFIFFLKTQFWLERGSLRSRPCSVRSAVGAPQEGCACPSVRGCTAGSCPRGSAEGLRALLLARRARLPLSPTFTGRGSQ